MYTSQFYKIITKILLESLMVIGVFLFFYHLRGVTDLIPFVQLRIPQISYEQFIPFLTSGVLLWVLIFLQGGLYSVRSEMPFIEEIRRVLQRSTIWFFFYVSFVYLTTGFLFEKEIPRLIVIYVYIFSTFFSLVLRFCINTIYDILIVGGYIEKKTVLIIGKHEKMELLKNDIYTIYIFVEETKQDIIESYIRDRKIQSIMIVSPQSTTSNQELIGLARIYGITVCYPKFWTEVSIPKKQESYIGPIPVITADSVSINIWERVIKRCMDISVSLFGIILCLPLFILIGIGIKIEDRAGPIIFRNRRVGQNGKEFFLYKFRYMYWKYSVKDAYGVDHRDDDALKYEEALKAENDGRDGPLYKIKNDPRKMRFGSFLERTSLDELPQLFNVLLGDMSLIGPRPHQPREVDLYDEADRQVLTVKPGITGMAQVYGREKNSFKEEIARDREYIENYSLALDIAILFRTFFVIVERIWKNR